MANQLVARVRQRVSSAHGSVPSFLLAARINSFHRDGRRSLWGTARPERRLTARGPSPPSCWKYSLSPRETEDSDEYTSNPGTWLGHADRPSRPGARARARRKEALRTVAQEQGAVPATQSFWLETAGPFEKRPAWQGHGRVDVAVVGGGFTGLSAAFHIKERQPELRVVLLEAGSLFHAASGRNAGFSMTLFGLELGVTVLRYGRKRAKEADEYMVRAALGRPAARAAKWPPAGSYPDRAASALASRTNSAGDSVSPRRAPSMPAAASASSTALSGHGAPVSPGPSPRPRRRGEGAASDAGPPDALAAARSALRSVLRRWPNAARTTANSTASSSTSPGRGRSFRRTTADSTAGLGKNTWGDTTPTVSTSARSCTATDKAP